MVYQAIPLDSVCVYWTTLPVHTNAFSFENAYFFYPFSPSVHTNSGIGMSQFHLRVKSINNRSNMTGYLALMLFALISILIACLELNTALINLYTLILRKRQSLVTKTDVFLSVFGGQVWTVENAAKTLDENLIIRFQETENGGFPKRISVDRA